MFIQLTTVIVDADTRNRGELAGVLRTKGLNIQARLQNVAELRNHLQRNEGPQIVLVNLDPGAGDTLEGLEGLPRQYPGSAFFVMSQLLDPKLLMKVMAVGAREFIPLPMTEEVLVEALSRAATSTGASRRARIIHVVPSIGGVGSTTVACNVAASLAVEGHKTCLVDLDLVRGGAASYFDLRPTYTVADVMDNADRVDQQMVENALIRHEKSGVFVLARPELPEESLRVTQHGAATLFNILGRMFDVVVIDSLMSVDPAYVTAVGAADINVVTMQLNVPSAKNAERFVGTLRRMGIDASKIRVIVNRFVKKGWDIEPAEVERALGLQLSWTIPNDYRAAIAAINYGEPVVLRSPKSEMSVAIRDFGRQLTGTRKAQAA